MRFCLQGDASERREQECCLAAERSMAAFVWAQATIPYPNFSKAYIYVL